MKKLLFSTILIFAAALGSAAQKIPLKLQSLPDPRDQSIEAAISTELIKEFKNRFPNVELSGFSGISIPGIGTESKFMLAVVGGSAPDVISVNFRMSDTYISQCFLYPLDPFILRDFGTTPESKENTLLYTSDNGEKVYAPRAVSEYLRAMPEPVLPVAFRNGPKVENQPEGAHLWAIGSNVLVRAFMWRKDVFQDAGLDPEQPPRSWDEMLDFAKRITDPSNRKFGFMLSSGMQSSWDFMAFLWSAGGEAVEQGTDGTWKATFDSPAAVNALDFYVKLASEEWYDANGEKQRGYSTIGSVETAGANAWEEGRVGMMLAYIGNKTVSNIDPTLVGVAAFPPGPGQSVGKTEINASLSGIFAGIQDRKNSDGELVKAEDIREMAWQYLKFLNSKAARKIFTDIYVQRGMGKFLPPAFLREFGYTEYLKYIRPEWEETLNYILKHGRPEPYGKNCQLVYLYITPPIDDALRLARAGEIPTDKLEREKLYRGLLKTAVDTTNEKMIGHITKEDRTFRNRVAGVVAIVILAVMCLVIRNIWKVFSPKDNFSGKSKGWQFRKHWFAYLLMLPAVISIAVWTYYPMVSGSRLAFLEYRFTGESLFTGLNNLADVLFSAEWWNSVWTTFRYMMIMLTLGFCAPIVLAVLLHEVSRAKVLYRTIYYLPAVMSGIVVMYMWKLFYQSDSTGVLNQLFSKIAGMFGMGYEPVAWLEDPKWALLACIIPTIWASAGPGCLLYLAALKGIPDETYEAADIDGANFFQKIMHITLPSLKALIIINFVGAFIGAAQSGGMILVMTFGRANTEVSELQIFKEAYTSLKFGSAIAMAWILGTMTVMFTIYQLRKLSNMEFKTTGK